MSKILVNYAFITTLYNEKRNFLDTYTPFVLKTLYEIDNHCSDTDVKEYLTKTYGLTIPNNTIKSILKSLAKAGEISLETKISTWTTCITDKGKREIDSHIVEENDIVRKQSELLEALKQYLNENGLTNESSIELDQKLFKYVSENISKLTIFDSENTLEESFKNGFNDPFNYHLTNFIALIERTNNNLYKTFEEIVRGTVINSFISSKDELEEFTSFEPIIIYLDANIILSLLGFHNPTINEAAKQLYELLRTDRSIALKVFTITLEEIARLLTSYKYQRENYNPRIAVNSIYYYLRLQNYDEAKIDELIQTLDKKVEKLGIAVERQQLLDFNNFSNEQRDLYRDLYSFKNQQNSDRQLELRKDEQAIHLSTLHDASIIWHVRKRRGSWVKVLERSKAIFLTSSYTLDYFAKRQQRETNSFPEIILDLTLTNIIWLRNPGLKVGLPLHKLIAVHSKKFIIDNGIWKKFLNTIKQLQGDNKIDKIQYAALFSSNQLTLDFLLNTKYDQVNQETIMDLSTKIEDILKTSESKIQTKDKEIIDKETQLKNRIKQIEDLEIKLETEKEEKVRLSKGQADIVVELREMKRRDKLKEYISEYLDENFHPIGKRAIWFVLLIILNAGLLAIGEVFDETDLGISEVAFKFLKFGSLLLLSIVVGLISKLWTADFWRYYFTNKSLRKEKIKQAEVKFQQKHPE
jgi:predicted nucleic acid-binding protein